MTPDPFEPCCPALPERGYVKHIEDLHRQLAEARAENARLKGYEMAWDEIFKAFEKGQSIEAMIIPMEKISEARRILAEKP